SSNSDIGVREAITTSAAMPPIPDPAMTAYSGTMFAAASQLRKRAVPSADGREAVTQVDLGSGGSASPRIPLRIKRPTNEDSPTKKAVATADRHRLRSGFAHDLPARCAHRGWRA